MIASRIRSLVALAAAAWFALPALAQQNPILIGVSLTQSPPGSVVQGTQVKDGMEILKDIVNAKGGVLGRQIKLVYEDNQGIPEKGRAAVEKLISSDKVVALAGGHQSSVCLAEIEVAHRYKVPYVNTNCWSDDVRKRGYPEVFNTSPYNTLVSSSMASTLGDDGRQARRRLRREHRLRHRPGQAHGRAAQAEGAADRIQVRDARPRQQGLHRRGAAAARQPARRDRPLDAAAGRLHRDEPGLRAGRGADARRRSSTTAAASPTIPTSGRT